MKYCKNCGTELPDDAVFCGACGTKQDGPEDPGAVKEGPAAVMPGEDIIETTAAETQPAQEEPRQAKAGGRVPEEAPEDPHVSKNVVLCTDGKYRWAYELNLFKDFWVLGTILKIFGAIILVMAIFFLISSGSFADAGKFLLIMCGIMLGLSIIGYLVYAAMVGGKYCVVFTMDDTSITQEQIEKQAKKANVIADLLILAGALAGKPTYVGIGMTSARRTSMRSSFKGVKKLLAAPKRNLIKMDAPMDHNRIWCEPEDFNFVWNYVKSRCEGAQITEKF